MHRRPLMTKNFTRIVAVALTVGACCVSQAYATDPIITAISFAITGTDSSDVVALDRSNCIFDIQIHHKPSTVEFFHGLNRNLASATRYYMNNIDLSRVTVQAYHNSYGEQWLNEEIHGEGTVYEGIGTQNGRAGQVLYQDSQTTLRLNTSEIERVKRAWNYIYSHGCHGAKASF
jgi:hypothetical protein